MDWWDDGPVGFAIDVISPSQAVRTSFDAGAEGGGGSRRLKTVWK